MHFIEQTFRTSEYKKHKAFLAIKCPKFRTKVIERAMVELFFICHFDDALAMELQTTLNTVCHDSIISYLVSLYQKLSSAKPNWFAAEMKGWQTAIHHRFCRDQRCLHLYETSEYVCAEPEGQRNERATNSLRVMQILWRLAGLLVCMHVCDACVCTAVDVWRVGWGDSRTLYINPPTFTKKNCMIV